MVVRAILFDVGGPLDTEVTYKRLIDQDIREVLSAEGRPPTPDEWSAAERWAIDSYASDVYQAIIWRLTGQSQETAQRVYRKVDELAPRRHAARGGFELREGIAPLVARLSDQGLLLGLAANQPASVLAELDALGITRYFRHRQVSGTHGYRKPDVRLFLHALADLSVDALDCVMVGDRIDNDIAPAKLLGMRTVLFRTGRHRMQQPRSWEEVPDVEVTNVQTLEAALASLLV
jgi:putative hydrolase of the HAD superfamily